jgi:hypothetical protein
VGMGASVSVRPFAACSFAKTFMVFCMLNNP